MVLEHDTLIEQAERIGGSHLLHADVDFCVTLGGDGTVLHLTSLFTEDVPLPPLVSFAMGTLGFLTPFDVAQYQSCLTQVLPPEGHADSLMRRSTAHA